MEERSSSSSFPSFIRSAATAFASRLRPPSFPPPPAPASSSTPSREARRCCCRLEVLTGPEVAAAARLADPVAGARGVSLRAETALPFFVEEPFPGAIAAPTKNAQGVPVICSGLFKMCVKGEGGKCTVG